MLLDSTYYLLLGTVGNYMPQNVQNCLFLVTNTHTRFPHRHKLYRFIGFGSPNSYSHITIPYSRNRDRNTYHLPPVMFYNRFEVCCSESSDISKIPGPKNFNTRKPCHQNIQVHTVAMYQKGYLQFKL